MNEKIYTSDLYDAIEKLLEEFAPLCKSRHRDMACSLACFVFDAIDKYEKGQKEHGGDVRDRNLKSEICKETIDLFWYNEALDWD